LISTRVSSFRRNGTGQSRTQWPTWASFSLRCSGISRPSSILLPD